MKKVIEILMERDGMTAEEAKELILETRDEMLEDPTNADDIMMDNLGLEPDYIFDILY